MKRIFMFLTALVLIFQPVLQSIAASDESWVVALYICGSDLESEDGAATYNIEQMMETKLPKNVKFVLETGGAKKWEMKINPKKNQRYEINSSGKVLLEEKPRRNMGDSETLSDFVKFVKTNYKNADHVMFIIWNHGGGIAGGIAYDEITEDHLTLDEIDDAFTKAFDATNDDKFDIIGFDACVMADLDVAMYFSEYASYMIASQESEPGTGWDYEAMIKEFKKNPSIDPVPLGKSIIKAYKNQCDSIDQGDNITMSMLDLDKIPALYYEYMMLGLDVANQAASNKDIIRNYGRAAKLSESFGDGDFGLIDLRDFLKRFSKNVPKLAQKVQQRLSEAVIYNVTGKYHKSGGISVFYPFKNDDVFNEYSELMVYNINTHAILASARLGVMSEKDAKQILPEIYDFYQENLDYFSLDKNSEAKDSESDSHETKPETVSAQSNMQGWFHSINNQEHQANQSTGGFWGSFQNMNNAVATLTTQTNINMLEDHDVYFDKENYLTVKLTPKELDQVEEVHFELFYFDEEEDKILMELGSDCNIDVDWDKGIITDRFQGEWPSFDGHLLHAEVEYIDDDFVRYVSPIKLNGKRLDLLFVFDYRDQKFHILGCRELTETTVSRRNTIKLKPGDSITNIVYAASLENSSDEIEPMEVDIDTFKFTKKSKIDYEELGDSTLLYMFKFVGANNDYSVSKAVKITIEGDTHTQEILD